MSEYLKKVYANGRVSPYREKQKEDVNRWVDLLRNNRTQTSVYKISLSVRAKKIRIAGVERMTH